MDKLIPSAFNLAAAIVCLSLAVVVLARNHRKNTHRAFAILACNLLFWALGVFSVIQSDTARTALMWICATEVVACFIPATFYHFIGYFPKGRFGGSRKFLYFLYVAGAILALSALTPWYVTKVIMNPDSPPRAVYGPAYLPFMLVVCTTFLALFLNLFRKLRITSGFERRQVLHVIFGICCMAVVTVLVFVGSLVFHLDLVQAYGPISIIVLMSSFAYAMIRFHLLDTRALLSRSIVMTLFTGFIVVALLGAVGFVQWILHGTIEAQQIFSAFIASLFVIFTFQIAKPRMQQLVEDRLLKQRYNVNRLYSRIAEQAAEELQLDELLKTVVDDIQQTIKVPTVRVLLVDEEDPTLLKIEFSTNPQERILETRAHAHLIEFLQANPQPILLEKILHLGPDEEMARVAQHLADLEAYFCLPLKTSTGLVGIMTLGQKESHDIYSEEEMLAFHALSGPLGTAIANARLYSDIDRVNLHLSNLFTQMREGVIAVDTEGKVTTVNEAAKRLVGNAEVGQSLELLPEEIAELLQDTLDGDRGISDFESQIVGREGEEVSVVMSSSSLKGAGHSTTGAVALIYDLSQVKRLEQNVLRADRLSSIGTLAAGMAHEIKNPLVSIKTFAHLLLSRYQDPDFRNTFKDVVPHEVDRIDAIVSRLLDFARPKPVSFEPQNMEKIVNGVLALMENQTRKNFIQVTTDFPDKEVLVYGDEQQLHQVFLNLVLNAVDAMKDVDRGCLHIEAETGHMHLPKQGVPAGADAACVRVAITDTGCGIPQKSIEELFTPFYTTKADGCGLGLAVVHGIVGEHGGQVDVSSVLDKGTTFTVSLPLSQALHMTEVE